MNQTIRKFFLLLPLCSLSVAVSAETVYQTYVNKRYGYTIDYPDYLLPQGEAANGDGQVFLSANDDAELRVYARACIEGWDTTASSFLARAENEKNKVGGQVSYRAKGKSFAVISGTVGNKIFYDKLLTDGNWCSIFHWTYAIAGKARYDDATKRIAASFKP